MFITSITPRSETLQEDRNFGVILENTTYLDVYTLNFDFILGWMILNIDQQRKKLVTIIS